jgi:hypothetical protein
MFAWLVLWSPITAVLLRVLVEGGEVRRMGDNEEPFPLDPPYEPQA